jgi:hypothetical protein
VEVADGGLLVLEFDPEIGEVTAELVLVLGLLPLQLIECVLQMAGVLRFQLEQLPLLGQLELQVTHLPLQMLHLLLVVALALDFVDEGAVAEGGRGY